MIARDDRDLLAEYARDGNARVFGELARRYAGLVYSAAMRQVRDRHAAEDVSQATFIVLSRRAKSLKPNVVLGAWLLSVTRYAARDYLKQESRRKKREQIWARQRTEQMAGEIPPGGDLDRVLDEAMARLSSANRDALVLRYLQEKSFEDVASRLGISEDSARQRVSRGLEKLRNQLSRRGVKGIGVEGLGMMLGGMAAHPIPEGLAARLGAAAGKGGMSVAGPGAVAKGVLKIMAYTKAKMMVVGAAAMLLVGGSGAGVSYYIIRSSRSPIDPVASGAAKPDLSVEFAKVETPKFSWVEPPAPPRVIKPYLGPHVIGYARTVDGKPVSGAEAIMSYVDRPASLPWGMGKALAAPMTTKTSADGRFEFAPAEEPSAVVIRNEMGMGSARVSAQSPSLSVILERWGRVEGVFRTGDKPLVKQPLAVKLEDQGPWFPDRGFLIPRTHVTTDEAGRFVIDRVPPGRRVQIGNVGTARMLSHYHGFDVAGGITTHVVAGGGGRVIVGRLESGLPQCDARLVTLKIKTAEPVLSEEQRIARAERARKVEDKMRKTPELTNYQNRDYLENSYIVFVNPAGQFRMEDIPAGRYQLNVRLGIFSDLYGRPEDVASVNQDVTITAPPSDNPNEPQDLGTFPLTYNKRVELGARAPELIARDIAGRQFKLSEFRGKYIVLGIVNGADDNWLDAVKMIPIRDRFGGDERVKFLTMNQGGRFDELKEAAAQAGVDWPLNEIDEKSSPMLPAYLSSLQSFFLIDPEGNLMAKSLTAQRAYYELDRLLSKPSRGKEGISVRMERLAATAAGSFSSIPSPKAREQVASAQFSVVDGLCRVDANLLNDGQLQRQFDDPDRSFRFELGTLEGRVAVDLQRTIDIAQVNTYSRHNRDRAPQLYMLYASDGGSSGFNSSPKIGTDPEKCGWKKIAMVDTRPQAGQRGGWYGSSVSGESGSIGRYRHLLFEMFPTETVDAYGHTFYGEIQVIEGR